MSATGFWNLFPAPKYLQMPAIGLDISDQSVKYVQLEKFQHYYRVKKFDNKPIPAGLIEMGEIKQKDKLIEFFKTLREEINNDYVMVSLPEEKGFLSKIELPDVADDEIRSILELQIENFIPISGYDAVFDYEVVSRTQEKDKKSVVVNVSAFPATLIKDYRDALVGAGFKPLAFETETHSLARALVKSGDNSTQMIVDFGKTRTGFIIVSGQKIKFTSTINVAGDSLTNAIMKDFGTDFFQAERIKKEYGFVKNKEYEKFFNSLLPVIVVIKDEIVKHITYWSTHMTGEGQTEGEIKKIILSGGDSSLKGFSDFLSYQLRLPVELSNPWVNIMNFDERIPEIELREAIIYSAALGLALRPFVK